MRSSLPTLEEVNCCLSKTKADVLALQEADPSIGTASLTAGAATVASTEVTLDNHIVLSRITSSGNPGHLNWTVTPGVSINVTSSEASDAGTFTYVIY